MCGIIACITKGQEYINYKKIQEKLKHRSDSHGNYIDTYKDKYINLFIID